MKEGRDLLQTKLNEAKNYTPDVLVERLATRHKLLSEELGRLDTDHQTSQELIRIKEAELAKVRVEIDILSKQLVKAQDLLQNVTYADLVCPKCGAPLEIREYYPESAEYQGYEVDVDHEHIRYECGLEIVDGKVTSDCQRGDSLSQS